RRISVEAPGITQAPFPAQYRLQKVTYDAFLFDNIISMGLMVIYAKYACINLFLKPISFNPSLTLGMCIRVWKTRSCQLIRVKVVLIHSRYAGSMTSLSTVTFSGSSG